MISRTMAQPNNAEDRFENALRTAALRLSGVEEGIACQGTAVESRTFKVRKKSFLFVRRASVMLKLATSIDEAKRMASKDGRYQVGAGGWVTVARGAETKPPPIALMTRWVAESHGLYAADSKIAAKPKRTAKRQ